MKDAFFVLSLGSDEEFRGFLNELKNQADSSEKEEKAKQYTKIEENS